MFVELASVRKAATASTSKRATKSSSSTASKKSSSKGVAKKASKPKSRKTIDSDEDDDDEPQLSSDVDDDRDDVIDEFDSSNEVENKQITTSTKKSSAGAKATGKGKTVKSGIDSNVKKGKDNTAVGASRSRRPLADVN